MIFNKGVRKVDWTQLWRLLASMACEICDDHGYFRNCTYIFSTF